MKNSRFLLLVWSGLFVFGCSDNSNPNDAGNGQDAHADTGGPVDSGGTNDVVQNDTAAPVNGCTSFADMTANGATVTGPQDLNPVQYTPNCVHIKAGQKVTFNLDFTDHPMAASGGDTPSPITNTTSGTTVEFTFPNPGTFGFHCLVHPTIMFGAVQVTQ